MPGKDETRSAANSALKMTTWGALETIRTSFALVNTDAARGSALSPAWAFSTTTNTPDLVYDENVVWCSSVVWGTSVV
jgi:hypothetical protein